MSESKIIKSFGLAISDFQMIQANDKIMVGISGGKDSYLMLDLLLRLNKRAPIPFEILAVHLDQKQPGFDSSKIEAHLIKREVNYNILHEDTYSIVSEKLEPDDIPCSLCSRLRRGILYSTAQRLGCNKIALGHHADDFIETLLLNQFFSGQIKSMAPKLISDDKKNVVIRPMAYIFEEDIIEYIKDKDYPIVPCTFCSEYAHSRRAQIKNMLKSFSKQFPEIKESILASLKNVRYSHLLVNRDEAIFGSIQEDY